MELIRRKQQKQIESDTCWFLLSVLNKNNFPFGIVISEDIQSTEAHYHKTAQKCYWVLEGFINLIIENVKTGEKTSAKLKDGDLITFEPFEKHQIVSASKKNKLVTITSPAWHRGDVVKD